MLAGVYDIKNLKLRIRSDQEHQYNSPWNIAAKFDIDMSFTPEDIRGMLEGYAADREISFNYDTVSEVIYDYTSGYPFLVSAVCKNIDEQILPVDPKHAWSQEGVMESVHLLLKQPNTLFDDMIKHLAEYPELENILQNILFEGQEYPFNVYAKAFNIGIMFGFLKDSHGQVAVANKIFETHLYNYFLAEEIASNSIERMAVSDRNQFIELKIWRGETYQQQGEQQLSQYLELYHKNTGYLLTFNFNKNKETGRKEIKFKDKILLEYMV